MSTERPDWSHIKGSDMQLRFIELRTGFAQIDNSREARLLINKKDNGWTVRWRVDQIGGHSSGEVFMSDKELSQAFGLEDIGDPPPSLNHAMISKYNGTVAQAGRFLRRDKYLNIPCPGTGNDGDPNISIDLNEAITGAVQELLRFKNGA